MSTRHRFLFLACALLVSGAPATAQSRLSVGGIAGYQDGLGIQLFATARDFASGLPVSARIRVGRTSLDPGSSSAARRIFINNATNGTPVESGRTWDVGLDALLPKGDHTALWAGVRYSRFKANFKYIGGNEDFDVTSSQWGIASGVDWSYAVGASTSLLMSGGLEYYRPSRLTGHDTSYSPDDDNVNPREDFTYSDANDAIHQPSFRPVVTLGFSKTLGGP
jgi:hypothetical protein